jgi:zinc protease
VVAHPRFDPDEVAQARETLKGRLSNAGDDFRGSSYRALLAQLYADTPYGRPVNGSEQSLDRLTPEDVRKFWQRTYSQKRMVVAVVGDIDVQRMIGEAQKAFQDVPSQAPGPAGPPPVAQVGRPRLELLQRPGPTAQLMVGYLAPAATRATYPVYALLDAIIGGGRRARLFTNIREKHSLGYELGSMYQPLLYQSHLVGYVVTPPFRRNPKTEQPENVLEEVKGYLLEQYRQLAQTGPTDQELARAKAYVIGHYALRQERTRDQAKWLAWNVAMDLGPDFDQYFATRVPALTKEEVQAAAKRSLTTYGLVMTVPNGS